MTMIRLKNNLLRSIALTLGSLLPVLSLAGCSAEEQAGEGEVEDSASTLGIEVPSCSQTGSSGYTNASQTLDIVMTNTTPTVVLGIVNGYITANGYPCVKATADGGGRLAPSNVKKITITGTAANNEKVVVDALSGSFGATILSAAGGIKVDLGSGVGDSFSLRGSTTSDKWAAGESGGDVYFEMSGDAIADLKVSNADALSVALSSGADTFTARGGTFTATHLASTPITTLSPLSVAININGGDGDDVLTGGNGDDVLSGGPGADTFKTHSSDDGDDTYTGGPGIDKMDYSNRTAALTVVMDGTTSSGEGTEADIVGADIENLTGGTGPDELTGNELPNTLKGGDGDDILHSGPAGVCASDIDVLEGEGGNDTFEMGSASDCGDSVSGGPGIDRVDYQARSADLVITIDGNANDGVTNEKDNVRNDNEILISGSGNDTITGSANGDEIHGGPGADTISGSTGNDILCGNSGNDVLNGDAGDDTFLESDIDPEYTSGTEDNGAGNDVINGGTNAGTGYDTLDYSARTAALTVTICTDPTKLSGNSSNNHAQCTDVDGDLGANEADKVVNITRLIGGAGADTLKGHTGNDTIEGGVGNDEISGGAGNDWLFGEADDDEIFGDAGDDHLDGLGGTDVLDGDNGTNTDDGDICVAGETVTNCEL